MELDPADPGHRRNASANSVGVVNRIDASYNESTSDVTTITDGIEMISVES